MNRKIYLDQLVSDPNVLLEDEPVLKTEIIDSKDDANHLLSYAEILKATIQMFSKKMLFSVKETADALNVSVEFIRKKITEQKINTVSLGDRKMISINELARLIHKGV